MLNLSKFVERLEELIFDGRLMQKQVAEYTGLTATSIGKYLQGNCEPSAKSLVALADYFKCTTDYLLGFEDENGAKQFLPCPPFPERLKFLLKKKGVSGYRFCRESKISEGTFYDWKNGKSEPDLESLIKIAKYLDCSVDFVLGREK